MNKKQELIPITDFIDFNYINIAFDITNIDNEHLLSKLQQDCVNHQYELAGSKYIAIQNCDLQGFSDLSDVYFDTFEKTYKLATVIHNDDGWFYYITDPEVLIPEE